VESYLGKLDYKYVLSKIPFGISAGLILETVAIIFASARQMSQ
jgi:hypothetical protein